MKAEQSAALWLDVRDNVATTLAHLAPGDEVVLIASGESLEVAVADEIPFGHKMALAELEAGTDIIKYGEVIGRASTRIRQGGHVHTHNCGSLRGGQRVGKA